jgi:DinB superfamily
VRATHGYRLRVSTDWTEEVLDQIDTHWRQRLRPRLDGLSDDEYFWQPVPQCWTIRRRGETSAPTSYGSGEFTWDYDPPPHDLEPMTTIAWRLGHLTEGLTEMTGIYFGGAPTSVATFDYAGTAEEALTQLDDAYGAWVTGIRDIGNAGLAEPQGVRSPPEFADAPVARVVLYMSVEVVHHGAEVCLLRDLFVREHPR